MIDELCGLSRDDAAKVKDEELDIIDLTQDEDEHPGRPPAPSLPDKSDETESAIMSMPLKSPGHEVYVLAEDEVHASLPELLGCLTLEELKRLAKQMKVTRSGQNVSTCYDIMEFTG